MTIEEVDQVHDMLLWYQTMMKPDMCKDLWGDRWEHYWTKWEESRGMIYFWNRLDRGNQRKLLQHYEENVWT